ncbi:hypothetical protein [Paracoccus sp. JM45]|uniref:hypothetical protein n=1 Tax=Paracoccus sp. JM45 TaxID=2283626 RepID=UPI00210493B3|nr:hypothetical protein [Paracoccus sp. JM45]
MIAERRTDRVFDIDDDVMADKGSHADNLDGTVAIAAFGRAIGRSTITPLLLSL